ncbi:magnesium-dependent phosphatase 1-like [Oppia nitens]|uniref:magnesium-dependent phosphatase 1-like n=1 Tax=Oppia nitens TaxID=1686743 RepID=UPI0023DB96EB|nr:magnesium-dependent phosphatase 1-like [Oppia nitens]
MSSAVIRRLPRLVVFDLDHTLWPFGVDGFRYIPPYHRKDGHVFDRQQQPMRTFSEVPDIMRRLTADGIQIGVASRTEYPLGAHTLIDLFQLDQFVNYRQIYPGRKLKHFERLKTDSGADYQQMMFFDDEQRNIADIGPLGVTAILVDRQTGVTLEIVNEAIKRFASKTTAATGA